MQDKFQWLPLTFHKEFIHPTYTHIAKNKKKRIKKKRGGGEQTYVKLHFTATVKFNVYVNVHS